MPNPALHASRLKLLRAEQHVTELEQVIAGYLAANPLHLEVSARPHDPRIVDYAIVCTMEPPPLIPAIVGDIAHNLRTSLDLLACALVRLNNGNDKGVYFPFAGPQAELEEMIVRRNLHRAAPAAIDLVRSLRPYVGGNIALRGVHDLDIEDKHRALIPTASSVSWGPVALGIGSVSSLRVGKITENSATREWATRYGLELGKRLPVHFFFSFPGDTAFSGEDLVPTFRDLLDNFEHIIDAFGRLYPTSP